MMDPFTLKCILPSCFTQICILVSFWDSCEYVDCITRSTLQAYSVVLAQRPKGIIISQIQELNAIQLPTKPSVSCYGHVGLLNGDYVSYAVESIRNILEYPTHDSDKCLCPPSLKEARDQSRRFHIPLLYSTLYIPFPHPQQNSINMSLFNLSFSQQHSIDIVIELLSSHPPFPLTLITLSFFVLVPFVPVFRLHRLEHARFCPAAQESGSNSNRCLLTQITHERKRTECCGVATRDCIM